MLQCLIGRRSWHHNRDAERYRADKGVNSEEQILECAAGVGADSFDTCFQDVYVHTMVSCR